MVKAVSGRIRPAQAPLPLIADDVGTAAEFYRLRTDCGPVQPVATSGIKRRGVRAEDGGSTLTGNRRAARGQRIRRTFGIDEERAVFLNDPSDSH